jgi:DNA mismatch repair ATPase MutL
VIGEDPGVDSGEQTDRTAVTGDVVSEAPRKGLALRPEPQQERIGFGFATAAQRESENDTQVQATTRILSTADPIPASATAQFSHEAGTIAESFPDNVAASALAGLPPLDSALKFVREVPVESLSPNIRPLGQLDESFIIATDNEGLLLIDQHVAHERVLFDKYRAMETARRSESQQMLIPETFDLTPAQAAAFETVADELESYGFELMRLSGRTVAIKATPADLPASEARNVLAEVLDTVDSEKRGAARATLRDEIAASLACHAAIKVNTPLVPRKMRGLIDRLLLTSSPTTCPHGRPVILRLTTQDILKGFHRI